MPKEINIKPIKNGSPEALKANELIEDMFAPWGWLGATGRPKQEADDGHKAFWYNVRFAGGENFIFVESKEKITEARLVLMRAADHHKFKTATTELKIAFGPPEGSRASDFMVVIHLTINLETGDALIAPFWAGAWGKREKAIFTKMVDWMRGDEIFSMIAPVHDAGEGKVAFGPDPSDGD